MRNLSELLSFGNRKLPKTTAIFNLGTAKECPSKKLGLCKLCSVCYAMKAERLYPQVLPYREAQAEYWLSTNSYTFVSEFIAMQSRRRNKVNALRFNESGDFYSQLCIDKMEEIARLLYFEGVTCYVYTARQDLDYSKCRYLQVNASGFDKAGVSAQFIGVKDAHNVAKIMRSSNSGKKYYVCCGDCRKCALCQRVKNSVILCEIH